MRGAWVVQYDNGEWLAQYDRQHPQAVEGEIPLQAIQWSRVRSLRFESQLATTTLQVPPAPHGLSWSLRYRTWMRLDSSGCSAFMLVLSDEHQEPTADTTKYVLFWYPDGTVHETPFFMSRETNEYGSGVIHNLPRALIPITDSLHIAVDAVTLFRPVLV